MKYSTYSMSELKTKSVWHWLTWVIYSRRIPDSDSYNRIWYIGSKLARTLRTKKSETPTTVANLANLNENPQEDPATVKNAHSKNDPSCSCGYRLFHKIPSFQASSQAVFFWMLSILYLVDQARKLSFFPATPYQLRCRASVTCQIAPKRPDCIQILPC